MIDLQPEFGVMIKTQRRRLGLTQRAIASPLGVTAPYISLVETGRSGVGLETLIKFCAVLGLQPGEELDRLLGFERDRSAILGQICADTTAFAERLRARGTIAPAMVPGETTLPAVGVSAMGEEMDRLGIIVGAVDEQGAGPEEE